MRDVDVAVVGILTVETEVDGNVLVKGTPRFETDVEDLDKGNFVVETVVVKTGPLDRFCTTLIVLVVETTIVEAVAVGSIVGALVILSVGELPVVINVAENTQVVVTT